MALFKYGEIEQNLIESSLIPFGVFQRIGSKVTAIAVTQGLCNLFGFDSLQEAYDSFNNDLHQGCHPDDYTRIKDMFKRIYVEGEVGTIYRKMVKDSYYVFRLHAVLVEKSEDVKLVNAWFSNEGPYVEGDETESYSNSISKAVSERTQLHYYNYDYLTGLPNMGYFFELAEHGREEIIKNGKKPCVMFFDLCGMKGYNQKFGFADGDLLIIEFSKLLNRYFGENRCGRFGSDHFCAYAEEDGIDDILQEILKEAKKINEGRSLPVRIGVYKYMKHLVNPSIACDRAKRACDAVRSSYRSCVSYFDAKMLQASEEREYVITNLDKALEEGWIKVFYQPIIRAANDLVSDEEALARWEDPTYGNIPPSVFIPVLEDSRQIYKLDLYVAEQILMKMKRQAAKGLFVVPISVNISRIDFNVCDIVKEITKLVDEAGIERDKLTIEITESGVGTDVDYMKSQIEHFQKLGFKVWMDDYGSGYSSPEILQEIPFDTIKLDMQFMRKFDSGDACKIILTELVKMACALGIETVAEGVENPEQVEFLKQIGCTKLQGYHYCQPIPVDKIFERYDTGKQIGFENPKEAGYYALIGRISLYDLHISAEGEEEIIGNYFDTMPMAIIEVTETTLWITRANKPYKEFFKKSFPGYDMSGIAEIEIMKKMRGSVFCKALVQCAKDGKRIIIDERSGDGTIMHVLIRRLAINPVTGVRALSLAILGINEEQGAEGLNYTYIAQALSSDYMNLYYVDMDTGNYVEYGAGDAYDELAIERHGTDFFESAISVAKKRIYEDDKERFLESFTREKIENALKKEGVYTLSYRILQNNEPVYVHMKIVRIRMMENSIIIGISNINSQMKEQEMLERIKEENLTYSRLLAISENYLSIFVVDPETDHYFRAAGKTNTSKTNEEKTEGEDFFSYFIESRRKYVALADLEYVINQFTKEKIIEKINENGMFILKYRFVLDNELKYAVLKAAFLEEKGVKQLIIGIRDDTEETLRAQETEQMLIRARNEANVDALTGVKNKNAYNNIEQQINKMIKEGAVPGFAMVVLDINGLKDVNDSNGHQAGDDYLKKGCGLICNIFRHCPVFRVGGDEFVAIVQGRSYQFIDKIMEVWERTNQKNAREGDIVIAAGVARYNGEEKLEDVFAKADALMYENKRMLKEIC